MSKSQSQSPKRTSSKSRDKEDEHLLNEKMKSFDIQTPRTMLLLVGFLASLLPAYLAHAVYYLDILHVAHVPLYIAVCAPTAHLLAYAYNELTISEFRKREKHWDELKTPQENQLLRDLRLQQAMGYAMFLANGLFLVVCTLFQNYLLRQQNPYVSFVVSPLISAAFIYIIAEKSKEIRNRKTGAK